MDCLLAPDSLVEYLHKNKSILEPFLNKLKTQKREKQLYNKSLWSQQFWNCIFYLNILIVAKRLWSQIVGYRVSTVL